MPLAKTILSEPVVLWRDAGGVPVILEDRCCHRHLPLSMGKVEDDTLQCGYHGLEFDSSGACVSVPGQSRVPSCARAVISGGETRDDMDLVRRSRAR